MGISAVRRMEKKIELIMTTEGKENDEQAGKPEEVIATPPELETRKERRQVVTEKPLIDRIREEPKEYSAIPDYVEGKPKKEASIGEFDDWILIETPRLETYNKESGTTQMKPRDMNVERTTY